MLRGDSKLRNDAYRTGRQWGWLSINDVRRAENLNPIGPDGDLYLQPLNMVPVGSARSSSSQPAGQPVGLLPSGPAGEEQTAAAGGVVQGAAAAALLPFARDAAARVARREAAAMGKSAKRASEVDTESWAAVVRQFYAEHAAHVAAALHINQASAQSYAERRCGELLAAGPQSMREQMVQDQWEGEGAQELEALALERLEARMER